jgi:hypothetical protein
MQLLEVNSGGAVFFLFFHLTKQQQQQQRQLRKQLQQQQCDGIGSQALQQQQHCSGSGHRLSDRYASCSEGVAVLKVGSSRLSMQAEQFANELTRHLGIAAPDCRIVRQVGRANGNHSAYTSCDTVETSMLNNTFCCLSLSTSYCRPTNCSMLIAEAA